MALLALALFVTAAGCDYVALGKPQPGDRPKTPAEIDNFAILFRQHCAGCHGADGQFGPAPPLADPLFLAIVSDEALARVITDGHPGTPMPAFARRRGGALTDEQIKIVAAGIKQHWTSDKLPKGPLPAYAATRPPTEADAKRGEAVYARACAGCHGEQGEGSGEDTSPGRINDPALLALISDQTLRRIVITGRPDLGMPNFADDTARDTGFAPLSSAEIDDLVALLARWRAGRKP